MKEYIEREVLLKDIEDLKQSPWYNDDCGFGTKQARHDGVACVTDLCIRQVPAADVAPVIHGEWVVINKGFLGNDYICSECHTLALESNNGHYDRLTDYCPNCGTRMDGGNK